MCKHEITFDKLPQAITYLTEQVAELKQLVSELQPPQSEKHLLVGIDDVGEGVCTGLHVHLWQPSLGGIAHIIVSQGLHHAILLDGRIVVMCHLLAFVQGQ